MPPFTFEDAVLRATDPAQLDAYVGFGVAEVAYVLARRESPAAQAIVSLLALDEAYFDDIVLAAGASSLVARGFAIPQGDDGATDELRGPAAVLEYVLSMATRWTRIAFVGPAETDIAFFVEAPELAVLVQPRAVGTWWVLTKQPDIAAGTMLDLLVTEHVETDPATTASFETSTTEHSGALFLRRRGDDWEASPGASTNGDPHVDVVPAADVPARIDSFLGSVTGTRS